VVDDFINKEGLLVPVACDRRVPAYQLSCEEQVKSCDTNIHWLHDEEGAFLCLEVLCDRFFFL